MTWFKVDDSFHSHPKVLATSPAALGLWVVAGSWSSANLTEGFVPDHVFPRLLPGSEPLAKELVANGLWRRERGGYRFHDWITHNPTRSEAIAARAKQSSGGAIGNHRRWHAKRGITDPACRYCQEKQDRGTDRVPDGGSESHPNPRPVPSRPEGTGTGSLSSSFTDRDARASPDDDKINQTIIDLLADLTGRTVTPEWADAVRRQLLDGRQVDHQARYVTKAIRERPRDFLPSGGPPAKCEIHLLPQPCRGCAGDRKAVP